MNLLRLLAAFSVLLFISLFFFSNTKHLETGSGYLYLGFLLLPLFVLITLSKDYRLSKVKQSSFALILFLVYFIVNYLIDTMNLQDVKAVTIGTTGGIIFALFLGLSISFVLSNIFQLLISQQFQKIIFIVSFFYILFVIWLSKDTLAFHLSQIREDIFLIENQEGFYQRVGNFFFLQFMIVGSLIITLLIGANKINKLLHLSLLILYTLLAFIFALTSQLIGSNSGLASILGFLVVYYIYYFIVLTSKNKLNSKRITLKSLFWGELGWKILQGIIVILFILFGVASYISKSMNIDLDRFRITGYGSGNINSVDARIKIFKDNFLEQLSYNPIFGNTQVDDLTTGAGTYTHSLISLMTHLGFVGFFLFIFFVSRIYKDISGIHNQRFSIFSDRQYALFRLFALGATILLATMSAFYTWLPLWFAIGLFGLSLIEKKINI